MAEEKEVTFLIVNPSGTMHVVSKEHARARLRIAGWRLASKEEQAAYVAAGGNQRAGRPLAAPFDPEPDVEDALDAAMSEQANEAAQASEPPKKLTAAEKKAAKAAEASE